MGAASNLATNLPMAIAAGAVIAAAFKPAVLASVARAVALATDHSRLTTLRAGLRAEMQRSPLLDYAGQAARFGDALEQAWAGSPAA